MTCNRLWSLICAVVLWSALLPEPATGQPLTPVVDVGSDGALFFGSVRSIGLHASGERAYVVDHVGSEVIVLDGAGREIDRWGRQGDGPGEFSETLSEVRVLGDEVVVATVGGIQVFRPDGSFVRGLSLTVETPVWALVGLEVVDSTVIAVLRVAQSGEQRLEVHAVSDDGSTLIGGLPWISSQAAPGDAPHWAGAGSFLVQSRPGTGVLEVLDESGAPEGQWSLPGGGVPLSRESVDGRVAELEARCEGTGALEDRCMESLVPFIADVRALQGQAAPPVGGMVGSASGRVVVLRVDRGSRPFETAGRFFQVVEDGSVVFEGEFDRPVTPMAFDGSTVWARFLGPLDEPLVVAYRLPM